MKRKTLRISSELFAQFLKEPCPPGISQNGIPADIVIVDAHFEEPSTIVLTVTSEQFDSDGGLLVPVFSRDYSVQ